MKIEILFDLPVSPNMAAANANETCSYPFSAILANGDIACIYRRGKEKHKGHRQHTGAVGPQGVGGAGGGSE